MRYQFAEETGKELSFRLPLDLIISESNELTPHEQPFCKFLSLTQSEFPMVTPEAGLNPIAAK